MFPKNNTHWRHYKSIGWTDHTYEVIGIAKHSETSEDMVVYRPMYEVTRDSWVYGYDFSVRPLLMRYVWWSGMEKKSRDL